MANKNTRPQRGGRPAKPPADDARAELDDVVKPADALKDAVTPTEEPKTDDATESAGNDAEPKVESTDTDESEADKPEPNDAAEPSDVPEPADDDVDPEDDSPEQVDNNTELLDTPESTDDDAESEDDAPEQVVSESADDDVEPELDTPELSDDITELSDAPESTDDAEPADELNVDDTPEQTDNTEPSDEDAGEVAFDHVEPEPIDQLEDVVEAVTTEETIVEPEPIIEIPVVEDELEDAVDLADEIFSLGSIRDQERAEARSRRRRFGRKDRPVERVVVEPAIVAEPVVKLPAEVPVEPEPEAPVEPPKTIQAQLDVAPIEPMTQAEQDQPAVADKKERPADVNDEPELEAEDKPAEPADSKVADEGEAVSEPTPDDAADEKSSKATDDVDTVKAVKAAKPKKKAAVEEKADDKDEAPHQVRRSQTQAPVKKGHATRKRDEAVQVTTTRTTPLAFARQSIAELRKVVWPTGDTVGQYFIVVLVFVLFIMLVVAGLDALFGWGLLRLFR
ncbi:MAG: preprotein translocase subunit SecE [Propionibacteriaceae bacterium]|nr:preprotein translocase subunit SecE [Propionibacteriaceae bacterium]